MSLQLSGNTSSSTNGKTSINYSGTGVSGKTILIQEMSGNVVVDISQIQLSADGVIDLSYSYRYRAQIMGTDDGVGFTIPPPFNDTNKVDISEISFSNENELTIDMSTNVSVLTKTYDNTPKYELKDKPELFGSYANNASYNEHGSIYYKPLDADHTIAKPYVIGDTLQFKPRSIFSLQYPIGGNPLKRSGHTAVYHDKKIYFFGGLAEESTDLSSIQYYDFSNNTFGIDSSVNTEALQVIKGHVAGMIDNTMCIWGGFTTAYDGSHTSWTQLTTFDYIDNEFKGQAGEGKVSENVQPRVYSASVVYNNSIYITGGAQLNDGNLFGVTEMLRLYKISSNNSIKNIENISPELAYEYPSPVFHHTAVMYNSVMYIYGGIMTQFFENTTNKIFVIPEIISQCWKIDLNQNVEAIWEQQGANKALWGHSAVMSSSGKMILFGGYETEYTGEGEIKNQIASDNTKINTKMYTLDITQSTSSLVTVRNYNEPYLFLSSVTQVPSNTSRNFIFGGAKEPNSPTYYKLLNLDQSGSLYPDNKLYEHINNFENISHTFIFPHYPSSPSLLKNDISPVPLYDVSCTLSLTLKCTWPGTQSNVDLVIQSYIYKGTTSSSYGYYPPQDNITQFTKDASRTLNFDFKYPNQSVSGGNSTFSFRIKTADNNAFPYDISFAFTDMSFKVNPIVATDISAKKNILFSNGNSLSKDLHSGSVKQTFTVQPDDHNLNNYLDNSFNYYLSVKTPQSPTNIINVDLSSNSVAFDVIIPSKKDISSIIIDISGSMNSIDNKVKVDISDNLSETLNENNKYYKYEISYNKISGTLNIISINDISHVFQDDFFNEYAVLYNIQTRGISGNITGYWSDIQTFRINPVFQNMKYITDISINAMNYSNNDLSSTIIFNLGGQYDISGSFKKEDNIHIPTPNYPHTSSNMFKPNDSSNNLYVTYTQLTSNGKLIINGKQKQYEFIVPKDPSFSLIKVNIEDKNNNFTFKINDTNRSALGDYSYNIDISNNGIPNHTLTKLFNIHGTTAESSFNVGDISNNHSDQSYNIILYSSIKKTINDVLYDIKGKSSPTYLITIDRNHTTANNIDQITVNKDGSNNVLVVLNNHIHEQHFYEVEIVDNNNSDISYNVSILHTPNNPNLLDISKILFDISYDVSYNLYLKYGSEYNENSQEQTLYGSTLDISGEKSEPYTFTFLDYPTITHLNFNSNPKSIDLSGTVDDIDDFLKSFNNDNSQNMFDISYSGTTADLSSVVTDISSFNITMPYDKTQLNERGASNNPYDVINFYQHLTYDISYEGQKTNVDIYGTRGAVRIPIPDISWNIKRTNEDPITYPTNIDLTSNTIISKGTDSYKQYSDISFNFNKFSDKYENISGDSYTLKYDISNNFNDKDLSFNSQTSNDISQSLDLSSNTLYEITVSTSYDISHVDFSGNNRHTNISGNHIIKNTNVIQYKYIENVNIIDALDKPSNDKTTTKLTVQWYPIYCEGTFTLDVLDYDKNTFETIFSDISNNKTDPYDKFTDWSIDISYNSDNNGLITLQKTDHNIKPGHKYYVRIKFNPDPSQNPQRFSVSDIAEFVAICYNPGFPQGRWNYSTTNQKLYKPLDCSGNQTKTTGNLFKNSYQMSKKELYNFLLKYGRHMR